MIRTLAVVAISTVALAAPAQSVSKPKPPRQRHHQARPEVIVTPPGWSYQRLPKHWAGD